MLLYIAAVIISCPYRKDVAKILMEFGARSDLRSTNGEVRVCNSDVIVM